MRHEAIFGLTLRHAYWPDGRCRAFALTATPETDRLARNHRLLIRTRDDGARVIGPVEPGGELFLPLPPGAAFTFHLRLTDADFPRYTVGADRGATFTNTGDASDLAPDPDAPPLGGAYAAAVIRYGGDAGYRDFTLEFTPRAARWAYYLVTDLTAAAGDFAVASPPGNGPAPISFGAARDFDTDPHPADPVATRLAADHPGRRRLRFVSAEKVAPSRKPRRVELRLDAERLTGPLPNPRLDAEETIPVAGGAEPAIYDVITYPPTSTASTGG